MERRHRTTGTPTTVGTLTLTPATRSCTSNGHSVHLTPNEFDVLLHLAQNAHSVVTHQELLTSTWGPGWSTQAQHVHVVVSRLRQKLADTRSELTLANKRNVGYILTADRQPRQTNAPTYPKVTMTPMPRASAGDPGNSRPLLLIGLDGETSSANLTTGGRLIQAGAAAWTNGPGSTLDIFSSLIQHHTMEWDPEAEKVHGITRHAIASASVSYTHLRAHET